MKRLIILVTLVFVGLGLSACSYNVPLTLNTVGSYENLSQMVDAARSGYPFLGPLAEDAAAGSDSEPVSTTNVQVAGIDEGDIVKVDHNNIYQLYNNTLIVTNIESDMTVLLHQDLSKIEENAYFDSLYITDTKIILVGNKYTYMTLEPYADALYYGFWYGSSTTVVLTYDIATLSLQDNIDIEGYLSTSRLIGDYLYVITYQFPYFGVEADPRPEFTVNDETLKADYDEIYYDESVYTESFTIISSIYLGETTTFNYYVFLGYTSWGYTYVTDSSIYLANTTYTWDTETYTEETGIIRFDFNGSSISFGGIAMLEGHLISSYSMDYYDGYLRVVTTTGWGETIKNRLYILKQSTGNLYYDTVGYLDEGLGKPGETVYSAKFNETQLTVVTYERTDPFYVIDLSIPTAPTITALLEIPGYSLYQHYWNDSLILGIGYETSETNQIIGLKLALYETAGTLSEFGNPLILNNDNGYTYSEALYNPKAILFDIERGYFGFTVYAWYYDEINYQYTVDYLIFGVDLTAATPLSIVAQLSHTDYSDYYQTYYSSIFRSVYVGDYLYAISNNTITKHDINRGFVEVDRISLIQ